MTRFQRGELMEGWNDCPPLSRDPSTTSLSSRLKRRAPRLPVLSGTSDTVSRATPNAPPMAPSALMASLQSHSDISVISNDDVDVNATPDKLRGILSSVPDKDATFFTKRIVDVYASLEPVHQQFISRIVAGVGKEPLSALRNDIVVYMRDNTGVSMWCVPLKKLVEMVS